MSALSEQEQVGPQDPLHYAPRRLRERPETRLPPVEEAQPDRETSPEPADRAIVSSISLDAQLENAVYASLHRSLDPEVVREPPTLPRELGNRSALFGVAGRFAAAIAVSAIIALFFVFMIPASRQPDNGSSFAAAIQSMKSAMSQVRPDEDASRPALSEFRTLLASTEASQAANREQTEKLLQQFLQWREKANSSTEAAQ
jgi:Sec-independent protein translocase protein TatA